MTHNLLAILKTISVFIIVVRSNANLVSNSPATTSPTTGTQLTPVSASVQQSACTNLNALPYVTSNQKETWIVGRAAKTSAVDGQNDSSQNTCHIFNYGPDCQAVQFILTLGQDGKTVSVSEYAYNSRTDTVAYREGKYVPIDNNYAVYREEMETKLFITREGAAVMASNPLFSQATSQGIEFAKLAQSKDGNWMLLESCTQQMAWIAFRADLVENDGQKSFVEYYRRSIDDTLKQCNINTSSMVEVQLAFPFAVSEIPYGQTFQQPPTTVSSVPSPTVAYVPPTGQTSPSLSASPTTFVYVAAPPSSRGTNLSSTPVTQPGSPAAPSTVIYAPPSPTMSYRAPLPPPSLPNSASPAQPTVIYASSSPLTNSPSIPAVSYAPPQTTSLLYTQLQSSPPTSPPTVLYAASPAISPSAVPIHSNSPASPPTILYASSPLPQPSLSVPLTQLPPPPPPPPPPPLLPPPSIPPPPPPPVTLTVPPPVSPPPPLPPPPTILYMPPPTSPPNLPITSPMPVYTSTVPPQSPPIMIPYPPPAK